MPKKAESYEKMMKDLESIVTKMENGEFSLEESMSQYEKGIQLSNKLFKILNEAEGKIKVLTDNKEEDFTCDKE